ncbi:hypothetical protein [Streptomyces cyaneofuscatus]|uniref:hypothetical protein n=1 Tax=Streptomyces cyaneofuscatus TaxID=66883 RepID=UPI00382347A2
MVLPILSALSAAESAPVHEQDDGAIRLKRPTLNHQQPLLPTPRITEPAPEVPDPSYLAEVVLSAGADQPVPRLSLTEQILPRDAQQLELSARREVRRTRTQGPIG